VTSNAVNYSVGGQDASGISIGGVSLSNPPKLDEDVAHLIKAGVDMYVVSEDVADRGISEEELVTGVKMVSRAGLAELFDRHNTIWHW